MKLNTVNSTLNFELFPVVSDSETGKRTMSGNSSSSSINQDFLDRKDKSCNYSSNNSIDPNSLSSSSPVNNLNYNEKSYTTITSLKCHSLYKIQQKIRSGGFGDVYKGTRKIDNLPIAVKIIRKDKINSWTINVSIKTK